MVVFTMFVVAVTHILLLCFKIERGKKEEFIAVLLFNCLFFCKSAKIVCMKLSRGSKKKKKDAQLANVLYSIYKTAYELKTKIYCLKVLFTNLKSKILL